MLVCASVRSNVCKTWLQVEAFERSIPQRHLAAKRSAKHMSPISVETVSALESQLHIGDTTMFFSQPHAAGLSKQHWKDVEKNIKQYACHYSVPSAPPRDFSHSPRKIIKCR